MPAQHNENPRQEHTDFYYSFTCGLFAFLLFLAPWYFSLRDLPWPYSGFILSGICYFAGLVFGIYLFVFADSGLKKHPELRTLLPSFMASEGGWQGLFGAATFLAIGAVAHWATITAFGATGIAAVLVKLFVYFVLFLALTQIAQVLDGFVVRPLIDSASRGEGEREAFAKRVRQIGALLASILGILAALATVYDVTLR